MKGEVKSFYLVLWRIGLCALIVLYINIIVCNTSLYESGASRVLNLVIVCGEIRQPLDPKMRQLFKMNKSVVVQLSCVQVIAGLYGTVLINYLYKQYSTVATYMYLWLKYVGG
jgi:hypothetical protein